MINCVTGRAGAAHITGDDWGHLNAGLVGTKSYVLKTGNRLKATVASANSITISDGDAVLQGRHIRVSSPESVAIQSGTVGQRRNDIICITYTRTGSGSSAIERAVLSTVRGTSTTGTPTDPTISKGNLLSGTAAAMMPLYRVPIDGVTVGTPVPLFNVLTPASEAWDYVSRAPRVITGSKSFQWVWGGNLGDLFSDAQFRQLAGRSFDNDRDVITVQNGDWSSANIPTVGTVYQQSDKKVYVAYMSAPRKNSWVRVCYAIVLGG